MNGRQNEVDRVSEDTKLQKQGFIFFVKGLT